MRWNDLLSTVQPPVRSRAQSKAELDFELAEYSWHLGAWPCGWFGLHS